MDFVDPRTGELIESDTLDGLATVAHLHDEQIRLLGVQLEELAGDADGSPRRGSAWSWRTQTSHGATELWRGLADWVGWLRGRYPLARQVPACWWRHPELVEELTAIWTAWREAFEDPKAPMTAPIDWHDRWLPNFLRRIGSGGWNISCADEHRARIDAAYDWTAVDDPAAFNTYTTDQARELVTTDALRRGTTMDNDEMSQAVSAGRARLLGSLPGSPIARDDQFWIQDGDHWEVIDDEPTIDFLRDADRRLALADEAVDRTS